MKLKSIFNSALTASFVLIGAQGGFSQSEDGSRPIYRIAVIESDNLSDASSVGQNLARHNMDPLDLIEEDGKFITVVGEFKTYAEAEVVQKNLRGLGFLTSKVISTEAEGPASDPSLNDGPSPVFNLTREAAISAEQLKSDAVAMDINARQAAPFLDAVRELSKNKEHSEALTLLESKLSTIPNDGSASNTEARAFAQLELGRLRAVVKRPQAQIIEAYQPVADGTYPAALMQRERAAAAIAHALRYGTDGKGKVTNKPVEALQAFQEVRDYSQTEGIRSKAAVECDRTG